jgi:hypothetical protein
MCLTPFWIIISTACSTEAFASTVSNRETLYL